MSDAPSAAVFGTSGYIGSNLVPHLVETGWRVRAAARSRAVLEARHWAEVELWQADALKPESLGSALEGIEVAFYLVHSMAADRTGPKITRMLSVDQVLAIDVSTSYHHPLEPLVFMPIITPLILLLGVSGQTAITYPSIGIALTVFAHSKLRTLESIERWISKILVAPDFHRLHHASVQKFTDSHYGGIVPWFDYLFGTATHNPFKDHETMGLG